jgi:peptidoglycan/xylan/chitin deacetylase (PgdA/CDA1 family)
MLSTTERITVPILLYHSVCDHPAAGQEEFTVTPAVFREHVRAICDAGRTPLTVSELASALRGERTLPSRPVLVTFDDGFADALPVVELLLGAGLAATVFVTSGWVGREAMLTQAGIRELAALGERAEVGAHSVTHPRLDELGAARVAAEIADSKAALEGVVESPLRAFAYPHGAYDARARAAVINAGFSGAAAVKNALSHSEDDPYALARVTIIASTGVRDIEMLLAGSGAPQAWGRERLRTRGYRSVRRLRRRLGRPIV